MIQFATPACDCLVTSTVVLGVLMSTKTTTYLGMPCSGIMRIDKVPGESPASMKRVCCPPPEGLLINPFGTVEQRVDPSEHVYTYLHVHVHVDEATPDHTTENCIIILNTAVTS